MEKEDKAARQRIMDLVEAILARSSSTRREKSDIGDSVRVYDETLDAGDFRLRVNKAVGDFYFHYSVSVTFRGQEVFADRARDNVFTRGAWEDELARLASGSRETAR